MRKKTQRKGDRHVMPQVAFRIPDDLIREAKHRAIDENKKLRELFSDAVREYLVRRRGGQS